MRKPFRSLTALMFLTAFAPFVHSQDNSALLDLLVRKKIISAKDADNVRSQLDQQQSSRAANQLKLSDSLTKLTFGGDLRLRYQYDRTDVQAGPAPGQTNYENALQRSRWRYRLRLNATFELGPSIFGGFSLATGHASDSNNQTFDNGFANSSIYINRAYLGWKAADWLTITAGKQDNVFYSTDLVWDNADVHPAGLVEVIRFDKLFAPKEETPAGLAKDGKAAAEKQATEPPWTLALNLGQYYYSDNSESTTDSDSKTDAGIFGAQLQGSYRFGSVTATFAPAAYFYNAASLTGFDNNVSFQDSATVSGATRKLTVLAAPGDLAFKVMGIPAKFYWDFAWNPQGKGRANDIYRTFDVLPNGTVRFNHSTGDDLAWLAGFLAGQNKKAGDLSLNFNFRRTGIASIDPNLNDPNFALGYLNTQGFKAGVQYNLTESLTFGVTYYYAWNLHKNLVEGEATGDQKIANANTVQVLQADLMLKF